MARVDLARIQAAVERDKTVNDSAITLLTNLATTLHSIAEDSAAVHAFADQLNAQQQELADAVEANTPGGQPVEPEEPEA